MKSAAWVVLAACVSAPTPTPPAPVGQPPMVVLQPAGEAVRAFVVAVDAAQYDRALSMLSRSWRAQYSAERLASDFTLDPIAKIRLERIRARLGDVVIIDGTHASLKWGEGRAVRLEREADRWAIAALE